MKKEGSAVGRSRDSCGRLLGGETTHKEGAVGERVVAAREYPSARTYEEHNQVAVAERWCSARALRGPGQSGQLAQKGVRVMEVAEKPQAPRAHGHDLAVAEDFFAAATVAPATLV